MIKKLLTLILVAYSINVNSQALETFHDFTAVKINGDTINLSDLAGKKVLVVNTASLCSYTPQYAALEQLYLQYGDSTFTILGFPCNDFGGQEPGNETQIDSFCTGTYNITFQMMAKISITATDTAEVYKWLQLQSRNGVADAPVLWNFYKFMIDEAGHWFDYKPSAVNPLDTSITNWIMSPSVLAVNDNEFIRHISISPNPAKDFFNLDFNLYKSLPGTIKLFSIDGKLISELYSGILQSQNHFSFSTNYLNEGIYFLKIESAGAIFCKKIAVIR